jgi:hypothetical protein
MTFTTKYDVGQEVYYMLNNEMKKGIIVGLSVPHYVTFRADTNFDVNVEYIIQRGMTTDRKHSKDIFPNAESLIHKLTNI